MKSTFQQFLSASVMPRLTLLVNHVLASEPSSTQRLKAHAGKHIRLDAKNLSGSLSWLPASLTALVTPAGLVELLPTDSATADLVISLDLAKPGRAAAEALAGRLPQVEVSGDAALAADLNWLVQHLRWDLQDDLARIVGDAPAVQLTRIGSLLASGLRQGAEAVSRVASSLRQATTTGGRAGPPPR